MARASRSSKKQPAFDPSELTDLIFSPAVGTGVGSHLLEMTEPIGVESKHLNIEQRDMATVDMYVMPTVAITSDLEDKCDHVTTVDRSGDFGEVELALRSVPPNLKENNGSHDLNLSTVAIIHRPTVVAPTTVEGENRPQPEKSGSRTVAKSQSPADDSFGDPLAEKPAPELSNTAPAVAAVPAAGNHTESTDPNEKLLGSLAPNNVVFWTTEHGDLVPEGRVKRIRLAQDVINSAEESVYDTLWTAKTIHSDDRESFRIVQAGYDYLGKKTRLSKKTIQRIVAKLLDKDFIAIEQQADIYQRTSTVYRVFSYKAVLERHIQKGRSHVVKMGPGFSYVRPLSDPRPSTKNAPTQTTPAFREISLHLSTVPNTDMSTLAKADMATAVNLTTETVVGLDLSTVVGQTTSLIGIDLGVPSSSSSAVHQALSNFGAVDDEVIHRLTKCCKQQAPDCTDEEIAHFIEEKGSLIRVRDSRIHSPIGFLLTAVPKCFSGEAFRLYRETQAKQREADAAYEAKRRAELDEWQAEQQALLTDPNVSDEDKRFIRECLGIT